MAKKAPKTDMPAHQLEVEYRPVGSLEIDPRNARVHSKKQIAELAESIKEFGFTQPILLRPNGMIGAGHGRAAAALLLKMEMVPTITVDLSEEKWRIYALADNAIPQNAEWNMDILREELANMAPAQIEGLGFEPLQELLAPPPAAPLEATERTRNQTIVQYNLVFDDVDQQTAFFAFLRNLKGKYPPAKGQPEMTHAGRVMQFIADHPL